MADTKKSEEEKEKPFWLSVKMRSLFLSLLLWGDYHDMNLYTQTFDIHKDDTPLVQIFYVLVIRYLPYWQLILLLLATWNVFVTPFIATFPSVVEDNHRTFLAIQSIMILSDICFVLDVVLNFFTPPDEDGLLMNEPKAIRSAYLKGWFAVDVLGAIPISSILWMAGIRIFPASRLNKMIRFFRLNYYWAKIEKTMLNVSPAFIRILKLFQLIVLTAHWLGLLWLSVLFYEDPETADTFAGHALMRRGVLDQYLQGYYWALVTMVGYGGTVATTPIECTFSLLVVMVGVVLYVGVIGSVGTLVANLNHQQSAHRHKLETITSFGDFRELPKPLMYRIRGYYDYIWTARRAAGQAVELLEGLPEYLRTEVNMCMNREIIVKVPLFIGVSNQFVERVVSNLIPRVVMPHAMVCRKGDVGREMFFVSRGSVDVISESQPPIVFATLGTGKFFGEIALLKDTKRTASIRAREHCDLFVLVKDAFIRIMKEFPDESRQIEAAAEERYQIVKTISQPVTKSGSASANQSSATLAPPESSAPSPAPAPAADPVPATAPAPSSDPPPAPALEAPEPDGAMLATRRSSAEAPPPDGALLSAEPPADGALQATRRSSAGAVAAFATNREDDEVSLHVTIDNVAPTGAGENPTPGASERRPSLWLSGDLNSSVRRRGSTSNTELEKLGNFGQYAPATDASKSVVGEILDEKVAK